MTKSGNGPGDARENRRRHRKPRSPLYQGNDEGGYGNPPVSHQFRENNRGGPGRPKGANTIATALRKVVRGKVPLADGKHVSFADALALAARRAALSNGIKGVEFGFRLEEKYGFHVEQEPPKLDCSDFNDLEIEILSSLLSRASGAPAEEPVSSPFREGAWHSGPCVVTRRHDGHLTIAPIDEAPPFISK